VILTEARAVQWSKQEESPELWQDSHFSFLECDPTRCSCFTAGATKQKLLFSSKTIPLSPHQKVACVKKEQKEK